MNQDEHLGCEVSGKELLAWLAISILCTASAFAIGFFARQFFTQ